MSSISRRRNGLMALSVIGGSCLEGGSRPLNLKTGRPLSLLHLRYQLPRERFSPMPLKRPSRSSLTGPGDVSLSEPRADVQPAAAATVQPTHRSRPLVAYPDAAESNTVTPFSLG